MIFEIKRLDGDSAINELMVFLIFNIYVVFFIPKVAVG